MRIRRSLVALLFGSAMAVGVPSARTEVYCPEGECCFDSYSCSDPATAPYVRGTAYLSGYNAELNKCKYRGDFEQTCQICDTCGTCEIFPSRFDARCGHYITANNRCPVGALIDQLNICGGQEEDDE